MKKEFFYGLIFCLFAGQFVFGQKVMQSQVPSVVLNRFQQDFPNARDIEWERKANYFEVDFELGIRRRDHEIWYDFNGKTLRHKQEISKSDLPEKVITKLNADYKTYRIKDIKKTEEAGKTTYKMEAKSLTEEWELTLDSDGNLLKQKPD